MNVPKGKYCSIMTPCKETDKLCEYALRDTLKNKYYCLKYEYRGKYLNRKYLIRKGCCLKHKKCLKQKETDDKGGRQ